ncbi:unnamed protein product [Arabidopsis halleri]
MFYELNLFVNEKEAKEMLKIENLRVLTSIKKICWINPLMCSMRKSSMRDWPSLLPHSTGTCSMSL